MYFQRNIIIRHSQFIFLKHHSTPSLCTRKSFFLSRTGFEIKNVVRGMCFILCTFIYFPRRNYTFTVTQHLCAAWHCELVKEKRKRSRCGWRCWGIDSHPVDSVLIYSIFGGLTNGTVPRT